MSTSILRTAALSLALSSSASVWAHGDPGTHFHASHGAGPLAGAVFIGALAGCALIALAQAVSAWRRRRAAAGRAA